MNILIYYQNSLNAVMFESLVQSFVQKGHKVFFLTTTEKGLLHDKVEKFGASTFSYTPKINKLVLYLAHWWYIVQFCRKHKIDVVYSHLQYVNLIAVLAQYFIKAKVIPCRHHIDEVKQIGNKNGLIVDKIVNILAKRIVVLSNTAVDYMVSHENVKRSKLYMIPLGYNFELYESPNIDEIKKIRNQYPCDLLFITASRMVATKRHECCVQCVQYLVERGCNVKLLITDKGEKEAALKVLVKELGLENHIYFIGYRTDLPNYLAASDLILHSSISESSNQVIKEGALWSKTAIVVKGVGDFDEYIVHKENGFLVSRENTAIEMAEIVAEYYSQREIFFEMGERLKKIVVKRFDIDVVSNAYIKLTVE
ncbi:MAG TPA: glycosyltransferase family 4 protein [Cytophagaceae bacterium]|jgi:glycosyltransferase involved in cell wall biosynthesis|nr:glycosyltransferase family 4 protein [Cytophagaceae bacterium]